MKLLVLSSLLLTSLCSLSYAESASSAEKAKEDARIVRCSSKEGKLKYAVEFSPAMDTAVVFQKSGKKMTRKGDLMCAKADESTDGSGRMRAFDCRDPKKMDAGYLATVYKVDETYQVELSTSSFAGAHLLGLLTCD